MLLKIHGFLQWVLVGLAAVVLYNLAIGNAAANEWRVISQLPTQRTGFSTAVVDGKIYLIGGTLFEHEQGVRRADLPGIWRGPFGMSLVEVYDPETNTWQRLADMPTARAGAETAVVDGKIYVMAGYAGKDNRGENFKFLKVVEMYDPQTDTWVRKQDLSTLRMWFGTGVVAGKIYAIGGYLHPKDWKPGHQGRLDLVEIYDPVSDTWTKRAKMPTRRDGFGTAVIDDTIYVIGGAGWPQVGNQGGPYLGTIEVYEPRINRWTKRPDMPNLRSGFSTIVIADKIHLIGGFDVQAGGAAVGDRIESIEVYNPATKRWHLIPTAPTLSLSSTVVVNGKIYAFGGSGKNWELFPTVEVFDTGFRAVTATGKLPVHWGALKAPPPPLRN